MEYEYSLQRYKIKSKPWLMNRESMNYQEAITRLQEIVKQIEGGYVDVDDLSKLTEEATSLMRFCTDKLTHVDMEVSKLLSQLNEADTTSEDSI